MKTFIFRREIEEKLQGEKTKFIRNIRSMHKGDWVMHCEELNRYPDFRTVVLRAFRWDTTPEGFLYWQDVSWR